MPVCPVTLSSLSVLCVMPSRGREYAKFVFTRHLSLALNCLAGYGERHGVTREQMACISVEALSALRSGTVAVADEASWLADQATEGYEASRAAAMVELPPLLLSESDFYAFLYTDSHANFRGCREDLRRVRRSAKTSH